MIAAAPAIPCLRRDAPRYADESRRERAFLSVDGLVKHYSVAGFGKTSTVKSLDGVSLNVLPGEAMGLVGESGCGKSTFAKLVTRLTRPTAGQVTIDGQDWFAPEGEALRRRRPEVQLIFQDPYAALDPRMTLGASMQAPLAAHGIGRNTADRRAKVLAMLAEVGLDESYYARLPRQCSGGQLQRIVIGRALLLKPKLLICDEPTSALDASMRTQILNLLKDLKEKHGLTMVLISHDLRVVRYLCDRIAVMYLGRIVEEAATEVLFSDPKHPYTRLLLQTIPNVSAPMRDREVASGEVPSPLNPPSGCPFHTRCPLASDLCTTERPALVEKPDGSRVACHFA